MKIALGQIAPVVGDIDGNAALVRRALGEARGLGARLVLFPELCLTGYPPHDLLERPAFVERNLVVLRELARETDGIAAVVGFVDRVDHGHGKQLRNAAALLAGGQVVSVHHKVLLPTYDVFDEARYFSPGGAVHVTELDGVKLGISVCEDAWNDTELWSNPLYARDPLAELVDAGAELLINLSASPFTLPKRDERPRMFQAAARRFGVPMLFVNQACGNDDLVFDGHSLAFGPDGIPWARGAEFDTDLVMVDVAAGTGTQRDGQPNDDAAVLAALVLGTRDYIHRCGFSSALVGLSGGIDSSVVAAVAARALGPDNVVGVAMPTRYSSAGSLTDAEALARNLGIHYEVLPIDGLFQGFLDALEPLFDGRAADVTEENIQARVRGVVLMSLSNKFGHMLLTTGNKSEMSVGYATLYGDMAGGLALIADVPKTLVYRVAVEMNRDGEQVPQTVIDKPPSAELRPDQKDSDSLPDYDVLDAILYHHVERGEDREAIVARGFDGDVVEDVMRKVRIAEYKRRQAPPCLKVTSKAFGFGRRMPIAQGWRG